MDRIDYADKISELLDDAVNELSVEEFDILLNRISQILNDYYI